MLSRRAIKGQLSEVRDTFVCGSGRVLGGNPRGRGWRQRESLTRVVCVCRVAANAGGCGRVGHVGGARHPVARIIHYHGKPKPQKPPSARLSRAAVLSCETRGGLAVTRAFGRAVRGVLGWAELQYRRTIARIWRGVSIKYFRFRCGRGREKSRNTRKDGLETARVKHPKRWLCAEKQRLGKSLASLKHRRMKPSIDEAETGLLLGVNRSEKEEVW